MEAGGGIDVWMGGDASDEERNELIIEFSVAVDYVVEDFLEPGVSRIHGSGGDGKGLSQPLIALIYWNLLECGGVWRNVVVHVVYVRLMETQRW